MIFERYRDLFDACAPLFWPWLWLQLAMLLAQKEVDGRARLIMVNWWGQVILLWFGDDPNAESPWTSDRIWDHVRPMEACLASSISQIPAQAGIHGSNSNHSLAGLMIPRLPRSQEVAKFGFTRLATGPPLSVSSRNLHPQISGNQL